MTEQYQVGDLVVIKTTGEVADILNIGVSTMGHRVYTLTENSFPPKYPFTDSDIELVEYILEENDYDDYLIEVETDMKHDQGKLRHSLIDPEFIEELLSVLEFGAQKYAEESWKQIDETRYSDALYRHFLEYSKGQVTDTESGCNHMAHIAANAMFILWKINQESN